MPLYSLSADVPPQTAEKDAVTTTVAVDEPVLDRGLLFIDPGANGEVQAQLRVGETAVLPVEPGEPARIPDVREFVPINAELPGTPGEVTLRAWAPDADFNHDVIAQVVVLSEDEATETVKVSEFGEDAQATAQRSSGGPQNLTPADDE